MQLQQYQMIGNAPVRTNHQWQNQRLVQVAEEENHDYVTIEIYMLFSTD